MRKLLGSLLAAALATATLLALSADQALATHLQCSSNEIIEITEDTVLDSDLNCPAPHYDYSAGDCELGLGLYVARSATLDLGGHTVSGEGPHSDPYCGSIGIEGPGRVTNGTVRGFDTAILATPGARLDHLTILDNGQAIDGIRDLVVEDNTLRGNGNGIGVFSEDSNQCYCTGGVAIERNRIDDTLNNAISVIGPGDFLLSRNVITDTGQEGIRIQSNRPNTQDGNFVLFKNRIDRSGFDGVHTDVVSTSFFKNEASFNGNLGFEAVDGVVSGGGNRAKHNGNPAQCVPDYLCSKSDKPK
jgi:hypothetical protein